MITHKNWHEDVFFGLHYDLHANEKDTELGRELTAEHLYERLMRVRPDWVQCDCKGHPGYTSWPTAVGTTAPGVIVDQVKIYREVTRRMGIKLGMHYSGVWDTRAITLHPEWARVDAEGNASPNNTCPLSSYLDELLIPQMIELIDKYDVDGFWVDGENWASAPCWCERCTAEFTRRTGISAIPKSADQPHWDAWLAFHRDLFVEHVTRYTEAVHQRKPECLVCSNWMYTVRQPDPVRAPVDYLSGDCSWSWGAERAAVEGRVLDCRGKTWDLMAWGFTKTGAMNNIPPWTMKTPVHLCQELAEVVALGGAVMIYGKPQRTGWLVGWHQDIFAEAAEFCRARKEACFRSQSVPQAAVLHLTDHYYAHNDPLFNYGNAVEPVEGALHSLLETHRSTDILTEEAALERMEKYPLVVAPEQTRLNARMLAALEAYARGGGKLLMSGAHLAKECPDLVGVTARPLQENEYSLGWGECNLEVDGQVVGVSGEWQAVEPGPDTEVWSYRLREHEPEKGDSEGSIPVMRRLGAGCVAEPAKDGTACPTVTMRRLGAGCVVAIHGPVYRDYALGHYPLLRRFLAKQVERMGVEWLAEADAPARLEMILRRKDGKLMVNLLNRGAGETLAPNRVVVEELPPVENVTVRVRRAARPQSVTAVPEDAPLVWSYADGILTLNLPRVDIHTVIAIA